MASTNYDGDQKNIMIIRYTIIMCVLASLICIPVAAQVREPDPFVPKKLMEAEYQTKTGAKPIKLSTYKEKVIVIALLAPWSGPCKEVVQDLIELNKEFEGRDVKMTSLSIEVGPGSASDAEWASGFEGGRKINFELGWMSEEMMKEWLLDRPSVPQVLVLTTRGRVVKRIYGWSEPAIQLLRETIEITLNQ
jgi:thiol-disulfide isomerase/thioredoxin